MPKGIWTWNGVWMLTNSSTAASSARTPGPQSVADPGHWLAGRLAVVTGASRGIGAATARALAGAGAHVVLAARDHDALAGVVGTIREAGGEATPVPADVSKPGDVERLFAAAGQVAPLAALVSAAGVHTSPPFGETTLCIWDETVARNRPATVP